MVKIISDSTCDLSKELLDKYGVAILPLHIDLADKEFKDGEEITPDEIFRWSDANKTTPKTSAPSLEDAKNLFRPYIKHDWDIIAFSISDSMSSSGNIMRLAAKELDATGSITVINSENLSTGIGLLVIEAAIMAIKGKEPEEIVAHINKLKPVVRSSFVVDTLTYLHRGGRCSGAAAMAGGVLKLHPKIVVREGKMLVDKKYRGKLSQAIMDYVNDLDFELRNARPERVFITHSGCEPEIVEAVRKHLESLRIFDEIIETRAGGVISSHCGPGTLGVLFICR